MCSLTAELKIGLSCSLIISCDNLSIVSLAVNPIHYTHSNHVELDLYFIWWGVEGMASVDVLNIECKYTKFTCDGVSAMNIWITTNIDMD